VRAHGAAVIFISHNMPHVFEVADRMIVLRTGRRVGTLGPDASMDHAVSLMTGAVPAHAERAVAVDGLPGGMRRVWSAVDDS
jgi:fructose transport system ATP-binding protein